jgi:hypothetical protein
MTRRHVATYAELASRIIPQKVHAEMRMRLTEVFWGLDESIGFHVIISTMRREELNMIFHSAIETAAGAE